MVRSSSYSDVPDPKAIIFGIVVVALIVIVVVVLMGSWYNIPEGNVGVLFDKRSGFDYNEKPQGWGLKVPIVQTMHRIPFRTQEIGFYGDAGRGQYGTITPKDKNGISFSIDITVRYSLDPTQAAEFIEQKGSGVAAMESVLVTSTRSEAVRGVLGQENQEDIPAKLDELAVKVREQLQARVDREATGQLKAGFIRIESVDLRKIDYNDQIELKIQEKQQAKQEAEKQQYILEEAEYKKKIELTNADRDKLAAILRAQGEAEAILTVATAKAEGIQKVNLAYQNMPIEYVYVQYAQALKSTDKVILGIESLTPNTLPILNVNQLAGLHSQGIVG